MRNLIEKYLLVSAPRSIGLTFNATTVAPNIPLDPLPSAVYDVMISATEEKGVKDSNPPGQTYYEFEYTVLLGEYKGRKVYDRLNCKNANAKAVEIAYGTLSSICHVLGVLQLSNTAELHNKPMKIQVVKIPRADDNTKFSNEIRGYMDTAGNPPKAGATAVASSSTQAAAFGADPASTVAGAPAVPGAPAVAAPPPPAVFPPEGWIAHPTAPGYFYKGQEVLTEAQLREKFPPAPATPAVPSVPGAPAAAGAAGAPAWAA